ncbi:MAG: aldo/keto reductase [Solirubrobacterales bacterium]|nr:aldo/keto reductase [Solirubrobacterales bacterium]
MRQIGDTELKVSRLCLGGNVFGWTADWDASFELLDAFFDMGGNFIDTADVYLMNGGESETILGNWMASRRNRDQVVIGTKVGKLHGYEGLSRDNINAAVQKSLTRLQTDHVDLYYAHADDPDTPMEETLAAFDALIKAGTVSAIAASNFTAPRLAEALETADREGLPRYAALQPHYNLVERHGYEGELQGLCAKEQIACIPYFALAKGFLTGKYRPGGDKVDSARSGSASSYLDGGGAEVIEVLGEIAEAHNAPIASVALAWLEAQPTVESPIASARTTEQLAELVPFLEGLELSAEELARLDEVSAALAS